MAVTGKSDPNSFFEPYPRRVAEPDVGCSLLNLPLHDKGTESEETTAEELKTSLSRDLHDDLGQVIALLQLRLALLEGALASQPDLQKQVQGGIGLLAELSRRLQVFCDELCAPLDSSQGLAQLLRKLAADFGAQAPSLRFTLQMPEGKEHWPAACEEAFYRVCQEALTNVLRHARAKQVTIRLLQQDETLSLVVMDDGAGVAPELKDRGRGLAGMRERLERLGGFLLVESTAGRGTIIRAQLPLSQEVVDG